MPGTWEEARSGCVGWCSRLDVLTKLCAEPVKAGGDQSGAVLPTLVHPTFQVGLTCSMTIASDMLDASLAI